MTFAAPLLLLDGASMWFRSFFGVPSSITAPDGRPVNAVRGFLDAVATVITQQRPGPAGGVPGPGLAPAVAGGPDPVVQGAPGRAGDARRRTRYRRGARRPDAAGRHDHGAARRVRDRHRRAHRVSRPTTCWARWPPQERAIRSSWSAATATCCRWSPTTPSRCGCSTWAAGWPRRRCSARPRSPSATACRPSGPAPPTPNWRCCAAIRPTGCPGVAGIGEKTAATLLAQHGSLERHPGGRRTTRNRLCPRVFGPSCCAAADYLEAAVPVVRVATDAPVTLSTPTDALPLAAADPERVAELAAALRRRLVDRPAAEGAGRAARLAVRDRRYLGRPTS